MSQRLRDQLQASVVLGVGAHADDVDFTSGGTIARLAAEGAAIYYLVLTDGSKGTANRDLSSDDLVAARRQEQQAAALKLGVRQVFFLDYEDGRLENSYELRRDIVRYVRQCRPDVVTCFDPSMLYSSSRRFVNHSDHRACGQATLDAVYPLARDHLSYPELLAEGLEPHKTSTLLLANFNQPNFWVDTTDYIDEKMAVFAIHASQSPQLKDKQARHRSYDAAAGLSQGYTYAEGFIRIDVPADE